MASVKDMFLQDLIAENQSPRLTKIMKRKLIPKIREFREQIEREKKEAELAHPKVTIKAKHVSKHKVS